MEYGCGIFLYMLNREEVVGGAPPGLGTLVEKIDWTERLLQGWELWLKTVKQNGSFRAGNFGRKRNRTRGNIYCRRTLNIRGVEKNTWELKG